MDIDVEVKFPLDEFLVHRAFSGFEIKASKKLEKLSTIQSVV